MINKEQLIAYSIRYRGDYSKISKAICDSEDYEIQKVDNVITILDDEYPECFRSLRYPPYVLYHKGNIKLLRQTCVSVVGARDIKEYTLKATKELVNKLKKRYVIVSGLAKGVDSVAHREALDASSIAILGCGIDYVYPACNVGLYQAMAKDHLIISEYPFSSKPLAHHFPFRNRLIAALGDKMFVMQAKIKSGTMTSAKEAIELGKEIYALPFEAYDDAGKGCNILIQDGANVIDIDNIDDL